MPDQTILSSPEATALDGTEHLSGVQAGLNKKFPPSLFADWVNRGVINLLDYGLDNTGNASEAVNNADNLQLAMNDAIANGKVLYAPPGTYMLGTRTGGEFAVELNFTASNQSLIFIGAGKGLTTFRAASGKVSANGRFDKMFHLQLDNSSPAEIDFIYVADMTLDKNGTSNGAPPTTFEWEQAHLFGFDYLAAHSPTTSIKHMEFRNIHIQDKVGGGITFSSSPVASAVLHGSAHFFGITESDFDSVLFGRRGDLEITHRSTNVVFDRCKIGFAQLETTAANEASEEFPRYISASDCDIDTLQYGATQDTDDATYTRVRVNNCRIANELSLRNVSAQVSNSDIKLPISIYGPNLRFSNCDVRITHNDPLGANDTVPVYVPNPSNALPYNVDCWFNGCNFKLDSDDPAAAPAGYAIDNGTACTAVDNVHTHVIGCWFDPRFEHCINGYRNGTHTWRDNKFNCQDYAWQAGSFSTFLSDVTLSGNDYSGVVGTDKARIQRNNALWNLKIDERWDSSIEITTTGSVSDVGFTRKPTYVSASPADLNGRVFQGSHFEYETPDAGGPFVATCITTDGTGGVWQDHPVGAVTTVNEQTGTAYTVALGDAGGVVEMNNAAANTLTLPDDATVAFPVGSTIEITQTGAGQTTIAAGGTATVHSPGSNLKIGTQYSTVFAYKKAADTWNVSGDLVA